MIKGILATAISVSLLALTACSSENNAEKTAEATKNTVSTVTEKATQAVETGAEKTAAAATTLVGSVSKATENATAVAAGVAATATVAAAAPAVEPLKDADGNVVITQALIDARVQSSREAVQAFGGALKSELVAAMEAGGPLNALDTCSLKAPEIAKKVSADKDVKISRISLKNRSLTGEPVDWQRAVLEDFEKRKSAGEDPGKLEFSEVVEYDGKSLLRFMKAIPADKEVCMACHGSHIDPDVQARLAELYPSDKATGFSIGDLRGAFVVLQPM